ncbi:diguanylate cyclase [Actinoplanes sp. LDG1-06]|uniref:Diguanylate cyclase n=1 Tax=Paractinoplanes ovalisporus TaxID=2810368 RepID=A0ABS2AKX6_9ACTN|nr:diguanylate cyclase [Actinoplanes ovalisporus]MBM2620470.1 diguanylate cyclase [Actinoplanes ovalisporus]
MLYQSMRTRVVRDGTLIRKYPLGLDAAQRLSAELAVLRQLAGVPGVPRLTPDQQPGAVTVLDPRGTIISELPAPWPVEPLLGLACELAGVLGGIHRRGIVHRDVNPGNILVSPDRRSPTLIDFELSVPTTEVGGDVAGTVPYLAPEQTGRTGRRVDHRADLYALGATLFELATGSPPFGSDRDPLHLIHDHLAKVPPSPAQANPEVPELFAAVVLRLLEKEPEQRYQSAEGLEYDLRRIHDAYVAGTDIALTLAERDFPIHLEAPSRLIGRKQPLGELEQVVARTASGASGIVLITGPPGVGKTSLVNRLRPAITECRGHLVAGKFDQYQRDIGSDAVRQAFCALGNQLLTESDTELARLRVDLVRALGPNARLAATALPPFAALLGVQAEVDDDPLHMADRLHQMSSDLIRVVARPATPLIIFLDDLQWAGPPAYRFLDSILHTNFAGLLVIGAYRDAEVDAAHPLSAVIAKLHHASIDAHHLHLDNLSPSSLSELIAAMLRMPPAEAEPLARALSDRTKGNPFDTVELINALRRDGALVPDGDRWTWDPGTIRRFVGRSEVVDMVTARIDALPDKTQTLLDVMARLGESATLHLVHVAADRCVDSVRVDLMPAVEEGLVTIGTEEAPVVAFSHDRVQQAAFGRITPDRHERLALDIARRLAQDEGFSLTAAQQYRRAAALVTDKDERPLAAALLRQAGRLMRSLFDHTSAEAFLSAASSLLSVTDSGYRETQAAWHVALCSLGRYADADAVFAGMDLDRTDASELNEAYIMQVSGLAVRGRAGEALTLGLRGLSSLGIDVPAPGQMNQSASAGFSTALAWLAETDPDYDLRRPLLNDSRLLAVTRLIDRLALVAFYADRTTMQWLTTVAVSIWTNHGAAAELIHPMSHIGEVLADRKDYRASHDAMSRITAVGTARHWDFDTARVQAAHLLTTFTWYESLEEGLRLARETRENLLRGGLVVEAAGTYFGSIPQTLDCADLDSFEAEVDSAQAVAERTGMAPLFSVFSDYRRLAESLRTDAAEPRLPSGDDDDSRSESGGLMAASERLVGAVLRALTAAVYHDEAELARSGAHASEFSTGVTISYLTVQAHLVAALGAALRARSAADPALRAAALSDLVASRDFLAARAAEQVSNFRHLQHFTDGMLAWSSGSFENAAKAFDAALVDVAAVNRPFHAALLAEHAGLFYLAHGMEHVGRQLLSDALHRYASWGAHGKVRHLASAHEFLVAAFEPQMGQSQSLNLSSDTLDATGVLEAARALSSETEIDRLRTAVEHVLGAMTGATAVHLLLWDSDGDGWVLPAAGSRPAISHTQVDARTLLPLSAIRYVERTREPMLVDDASQDDRVARDPYLAGAEHCSLLVVPVLSQGMPVAMLVLENMLSRRAFTSARVNAVAMLAGQLTVSLENARLYAKLERKVAERTEELAQANRQLELLTITDALTGLPNRRRIAEVLEAEWQRSLRTGTSLGLAMIDIDNFKAYNDHYGHQGGDECLRQVGQTLLAGARSSDLVARYGGEEFCVIMPGANDDNASRAAERIRAAVADVRVPHAAVASGIVTISVGVTSLIPSADTQPDHLIETADQALYEAKRLGRNRIATLVR